jgi:DNA-binding NtrC family response regulator
VDAADLGFLVGSPLASPADWLEGTLPEAVERLERAMITRALTTCSGNRTEAARVLGIHRQLLYEKIRRLGLSEIRTNDVAKPDEAGP